MAKPRVQVIRRSYDGACLLCGDTDLEALHAHRVIPGSVYTFLALATLCASCHAKWHAGRVVFHGRRESTGGPRLHVSVDHIEMFLPDSRRFAKDLGNVWDVARSILEDKRRLELATLGKMPEGKKLEPIDRPT